MIYPDWLGDTGGATVYAEGFDLDLTPDELTLDLTEEDLALDLTPDDLSLELD